MIAPLSGAGSPHELSTDFSVAPGTRECAFPRCLRQARAGELLRGTPACKSLMSATARRRCHRIKHADATSYAQALNQASTLFLQRRAHALRPDAVNHRAFQVRIAA